MEDTVNNNFRKIYSILIKTNKKTIITKSMGYTTTTQLNNVLNNSICISTNAILGLVKTYGVNPNFLFTGMGDMFLNENKEYTYTSTITSTTVTNLF